MNALLITYDLNAPGRDYGSLHQFLKGLPWWHCLESTWIVITPLSARDLRDRIRPFLDEDDKLLVLNVSGAAWASVRLGDRCNTWLQEHL